MFLSLLLLVSLNRGICAPTHFRPAPQAPSNEHSALTGVYRIDIPASDKLYSVVAGASSNVPYAEQQRFFIDLAVRLTPPDLLAIEQRGASVSLGSSRASRMTFVADGVSRNVHAQDGHLVRVRFSIEDTPDGRRLVFTSSGRTEDNFTIVFESLDNGQRLQVVRRIEADALDQPLVIRTVYNKISEVAHWNLYGETQTAAARPSSDTFSNSGEPKRSTGAIVALEPGVASSLRQALNQWIDATNKRDINKQMSFYVPRLKAFYLTRDTPVAFVREEKARVFARARLIDIRGDEPEIIFPGDGRTAIMRYRKTYRIENGRQSRHGEVIQELRWQREGQQWRIFSERDIRVLR